MYILFIIFIDRDGYINIIYVNYLFKILSNFLLLLGSKLGLGNIIIRKK